MVRMMLGALLMLAATPAMATDWTAIAVSDTSIGASMSFADRDSVQVIEGGLIRVEIGYVLETDSDGVAGFQAQYDFDCEGNRFRRHSFRTYAVDGRVLSDSPLKSEWFPVVPEQATGAISRFICSGEVSKAETRGLGAALPIAWGREHMNDGGPAQ